MKTTIKALGAALSVLLLFATLSFFAGIGIAASAEEASPLAPAAEVSPVAPTPTPTPTPTPAPAPVPGEVISLPGVTIPGWLTMSLSIFGAVSIAYQALIAAAHKRAAETADLADDKWIASLEAQAWFRILDKLFYWGGYLGAKLGGKKL